MQCAEFRLILGTDPKRSSADIEAHRSSCAPCAKYGADMQRLDRMVSSALEVPGPTQSTPPWNQTRPATRWYALAASVLLAVLIGAGSLWWIGERREALIVEVVKHAGRESSVLVTSAERVTSIDVKKALARAGAMTEVDLPISTARVCKIRGVVAPHLILQTEEGAVALLLLTSERVSTARRFTRLGYEGTIVPVGDHSIAIVGTSPAAVAEGARLAGDSIRWNDQ